MKITTVFFSVALLGMISCNQNKKPNEDTTHNNDRQKEEAVEKNKSTEAFNFEKIPLSTKEVGNFPYVVAPEGYRFANEKEKRIEEKYFFHNDSLVKKVNGQYFHATVYQNGDVFEDTFLVNMLKEQIEQLGGVEIFSGGLPYAASEMIQHEKPNYVTDMYDPMPYKYKQFLLRRQNENIWIELCHGLNANQIDVSVVREDNKQ